MKLGLLSITLSFFISSTLLGNISSFENNYSYSLFFTNQDTTFKDSISIVFKASISGDKFKSPSKAMLYSAVLPGLGQAYMGKWKRGLIYLALDGIAVGVWHQNNLRAEKRKIEYKSYAEDYWDFAYWIHDYYKWYSDTPYDEFPGNQDDWDAIRRVFVNNTGDYCAASPHCYIDIWDHSHSIKFTWNDKFVSSSSLDFEEKIFDELCEPIYSENSISCNNDIPAIYGIMTDSLVVVSEDHHFYEGIQKYDMFIAGWMDNDSIVVISSGNNDENATTPYENAYQRIYSDYDLMKTLAGRGGKFMLINRVVSMLDAVLLAKKWNNKHDVKLSLNVYPDLRNISGIGGVKLSLKLK